MKGPTWTAPPGILIIDDEPMGIRLMQRVLGAAGYHNLVTTTDPLQAATLARISKPDLIVLDLHMPGFDGFDVLDALEGIIEPGGFLPVLVLTGDQITETRRQALGRGATDFLTKPFDTSEFILRVRNLLQTRLLHLTVREQKDELQKTLNDRDVELEEARLEVLERLALAAELRDAETGRHMRSVGELSASLATRLGVDAQTTEIIRRAAPLHDIGKIGVPDGTLLKRGALTDDERDIIRAHTIVGERLLSGGCSALVQMAAVIARHHHEKWDGTGYPDGLSGRAIPFAARIVAVADVFDALVFDRPYRPAFPEDVAIEMILQGSGTHFDPAVVEVFRSLEWVKASSPTPLRCAS